MVETLVQLMVTRWYLPEAQVRAFLIENFGANPSLEQLRELTTELLQDTIINSEGERNEARSQIQA